MIPWIFGCFYSRIGQDPDAESGISGRKLLEGGDKLGRVACCPLCTTIVPVLCYVGSGEGLSAGALTKERTGSLQKAFADDGEAMLGTA
jgi:hypothetical protein